VPDANGNLIPDDVQSYTQGRLLASDPETQRALNAAIAALQHYCGWHVSPVIQETVTLDGTGQNDLWLPTLKIVSIDSITAYDPGDGSTTTIDTTDPTQFSKSSEAPGFIYRGRWQRWPWGHGNITVEYTHGYDDAYDWQGAVLELVDRMTSQVGMVAGNSGPVVGKKVDDVEVRWADRAIGPNASLFYGIDHALVDHYRLMPFA
jgi:hypothetical protein